MEISNRLKSGLLRARGERPCDHRCTEKCYELAPVHSITSSAWTSTAGGIVSPSALAVLRLTTSSNLVGCWIGRSPGFVPFRILSTRTADRRTISAILGPWLANPPAAANPLAPDNTGSRYLRDRSAMALGFA